MSEVTRQRDGATWSDPMRSLTLLVVERESDGLTCIQALERPDARLQLLALNGVVIGRKWVSGISANAYTVAEKLRKRFQHACIDQCGTWFAVEYQDAMDAVAEYDLKTGKRIGAREIGLDSHVFVEGVGEGHVIGFVGSRIEVTHKKFPHASLITLAPQRMVHLVEALQS